MGDCCKNDEDARVRESVREAYGKIAAGGSSCCGPASCCADARSVAELAKRTGYAEEDLSALPDGANMGLSCGNPTALASLDPGNVVLDLGSGGGFDVFIAARKVGPEGRVIGVDMTAQMIKRARGNAIAFTERTGLDNVEFRLGEIEHLPVADNSVDVVISNCVINLSPDKPQVWREMFRVLRPGGRVAVSDLALRQPLPDSLRQSVEALVGCVAGAALMTETGKMAREAGFEDVTLNSKPHAVDVMMATKDPLFRSVLSLLPPGGRLSDYVTSLDIAARKPL